MGIYPLLLEIIIPIHKEIPQLPLDSQNRTIWTSKRLQVRVLNMVPFGIPFLSNLGFQNGFKLLPKLIWKITNSVPILDNFLLGLWGSLSASREPFWASQGSLGRLLGPRTFKNIMFLKVFEKTAIDGDWKEPKMGNKELQRSISPLAPISNHGD